MADNDAAASSSARGAPPASASSDAAPRDGDTRPLHFLGLPPRLEAYEGENNEIDQLAALMLPPQVPSLDQVLDGVPDVAQDVAPPPQEVEQNQDDDDLLGPQDLDRCFSLGKWELALGILADMIASGEAFHRAVNGIHADSLDIRRSHPELVILLRGQVYFDMKKRDASGAQQYYEDTIASIYPENDSTGSSFADKLLEKLRNPEERLRGIPDLRGDAAETERSVYDYLKIYFPAFRPVLEEGTSRVWLLGKKQGRVVRCFACHQEFMGYDKSKLRYHLLCSGKQAKCQAVSSHINALVKDILAEEGLNPDGTTRKQASAPRPGRALLAPPPDAPPAAANDAPRAPPPANGDDGAPPASLVPGADHGDDGAPPAPPSVSAAANGVDGAPAAAPLPAADADDCLPGNGDGDGPRVVQ